MSKENIGGFWKWFWIALAGTVFATIWYFIITAGLASYYEKEGNSFYYKEKYEKAIEAYDTSLKFDAENAIVYNSLGFTYYVMENHEKAMEAYNKALAIDPDDENVYFNMGTIFLKEKKYDKALESYEKVVALAPNYADVYNTMGIVYSEMGNYAKARELFLKYMKSNPDEDYIGYNNIFELDLTNYHAFDKELEATFLKNFSEDEEALIAYDMLKNLELISEGKQENIMVWDEKYRDVSLGGWGFEEIDKWIVEFKDETIKQKLIEAERVIKAHKND